MTPQQLSAACQEIGRLWPDALVYPNPPAAPNGYKRNPDVRDGAICVDVDRAWPHECEDDDCNLCCGWYELVAWVDVMGVVHYTPLGLADKAVSQHA